MKIYQIMSTRNRASNSRPEEGNIQFFMPHGVTPKQFEAIDNKAQVIKLVRIAVWIKQGEKQE
jgi:hypothetical protein